MSDNELRAAIHAQLAKDHFGKFTPHPDYLAPTSDMGQQATRIAKAVKKHLAAHPVPTKQPAPVADSTSKQVLFLRDSMVFPTDDQNLDLLEKIAKMTDMFVIVGPEDPTVHGIDYRQDTVGCGMVMREPYLVSDDLEQISCPACRRELICDE